MHLIVLLLKTRLPVTRWVKLSLNFELLVKKVMKFLLGQRLFNNNIFEELELFRIQETTKKINERNLNKRKLNTINFIQEY